MNVGKIRRKAKPGLSTVEQLSRSSLTYLPKVTEEKQTGGATYRWQIVMHLVSRPKWIKVKNLRGILGKVPMS